MKFMESGRWRKVPLDGRTPGPTGTWEQVEDSKGGNHTGEGRHGLHEELLWYTRHGREAQTSGGGRRAGAPSRWMVDMLPGERWGGISGCKEREKWCRLVKDGGR